MYFNTGFLYLISGLIGFIIYKLYKLANYFKVRNIPHVPAMWPLGSDMRGALIKDHYAKVHTRIYKNMASYKIVGFYNYIMPVIMIRDPEYVHQVLITDFTHFYDRGFTVDEKKDPLDGHLFFQRGPKWRFLRTKLLPVFSSAKLKWMFSQMKACSEKFIDYFETSVTFNKDVDLIDTYIRLSTDVITSCAFGIDSNAMSATKNKFIEMGEKFFAPSVKTSLKFVARFAMPNLLIALKIPTEPKDVTEFFTSTVKDTMNYRLRTGYVRKDFVQLLLELREKGFVESEDNGTENPLGDNDRSIDKNITSFDIDNNLLAAQLYIFFLGGYETTAHTLSTATYLLSINEECQDKARAEAKKAFEKKSDFTYDSLKDLHYLDNCLKESLRMFPPGAALFRECTKAYTFPDGTHIEAGQSVNIPVYALHHDPQYFPEPHKFKPERFDKPVTRGTYIPFGDGPRICIGKRFAETEIKLVLAKLLLLYKFSPASIKSRIDDLKPSTLALAPNKPLFVKISKITNC